ncbi:MAG TPA: molecular chaperone TorD family protein [Acidimicrobiia bacterium]|nr:molecular chaperone TorD family protein [Acidimicrobiia bacterium]
MTTEDRACGEMARLRQGLYRFFGGAMLPPDADRVEAVLAAADMLDGLGVDDFAFAVSWRAFTATLEDLPPLEELEADYIRLFIPGAGGLCPALESEYSAPPGPRAALVVVELERHYRQLGLAPAPHVTHTSDHAATELEAMAVLCHREAHAWEEGALGDVVEVIRAEWSFLDRHLARWFPLFAHRLRDASSSAFFLALVDATDAFVRHDHEIITILAGTRFQAARR